MGTTDNYSLPTFDPTDPVDLAEYNEAVIEIDRLIKDLNDRLSALPSVPSLPLSVANGGTGRSTLTQGAILYGSGTGTVGQSSTNAGACYRAVDGGAPSFATLPVSVGGTGQSSLTSGALLVGNGTSGISATSTDAGVCYRASAGAAPRFGVCTVANGGTGAQTAANARTNLGFIQTHKSVSVSAITNSAHGTMSGSWTTGTINSQLVHMGYNSDYSIYKVEAFVSMSGTLSNTRMGFRFNTSHSFTTHTLDPVGIALVSDGSKIWTALPLYLHTEGTYIYITTDSFSDASRQTLLFFVNTGLVFSSESD